MLALALCSSSRNYCFGYALDLSAFFSLGPFPPPAAPVLAGAATPAVARPVLLLRPRDVIVTPEALSGHLPEKFVWQENDLLYLYSCMLCADRGVLEARSESF